MAKRASSRLLVPLTALAVLGVGAAARAYSVSNHVRLTDRASELLRRCAKYGVALPAPDAALTRILQHYNSEQDGLLRKTGLWHFPAVRSAQDGACPGPFPSCQLVIERSFEPWTAHIWSRVRQSLPRDQLMAALGAALHYVQDLAVPAHAIPVFHPEGLLHPSDGVDNYAAWDNAYSYPKPEQMANECRSLRELALTRSLPELLRAVRSSTMTSLNETFTSRGAQVPFFVFWQPDAGVYECTPPHDMDEGPEGCRLEVADNARPEHGFGRYACDDDFGDASVDCGWNEYLVSGEDYRAFAGRRARAAIFFSAATILLFQRYEAPCPSGACTPRKGIEAWYPTRSRIKTLSRARDAR